MSELKDNESYLVTIIDITAGQRQELTISVTDTKYVIPESLRPEDNIPHIFRWIVVPVAQIGVDETGLPRYRNSGPVSEPGYFSWLGNTTLTTPEP